jgi:multidrug efflux pump subunit AcrB
VRASAFSIILIFIALTVGGWFFIPQQSVQLNAVRNLPYLTVSFSYNGATPEAVSSDVMSVLEPAVTVLQGITKMESFSYQNYGIIRLELERALDLDYFRFELSSVIRQVYPQLPTNVSFPQISMTDTDDEDKVENDLLVYSLSGHQSPAQIQEYAQQYIVPQLSGIAGVEKIVISGGNTEVLQISYLPSVLQGFGLTAQAIRQSISSFYKITELGRVSTVSGETELFVRLENKGNSEDPAKIPVARISGKIIYLGDISTIQKTELPPTAYRRLNGRNTINLTVFASKWANSIEVAKTVRKRVDNISDNSSGQFSLSLEHDATGQMIKELNKIYWRSFFAILILLIFVFLIRFDWRYLLIVTLSLLSTLSMAFAIYSVLGVQIQMYSLAGITISLGFAIDNSLVMFEHIRSHGNRKVFIAVLASTLTTIASLSGIFLLEDDIRLLLIDFALVIIINLSVSLIVALFFIPALVEKLYQNRRKLKLPRWYFKSLRYFEHFYAILISWQRKKTSLSVLFFMLLFGLPVYLLPSYVPETGFWSKVYNASIGTEFYSQHLRGFFNKTLGGTSRLFNFYVFEQNFYGEESGTKLYVTASAPYGTTLSQLNDVFTQMESFLLQFPEIESFVTEISSVRNAHLVITFTKESEKGLFPYRLKNLLSAFAMDFGALNWTVYGVGKAFSTGFGVSMPGYIISLKGYNYAQLQEEAALLKTKILEHPRVQEVLITSPASRSRGIESYQLSFDKEKLLLAQTNLQDVMQQIRDYTSAKSYDMLIYYHEKPLAVKLNSILASGFDFWNLQHVPLGNDSVFSRLNHLAEIKKVFQPVEIYRVNQEYEVYLRYNYVGSEKFGNQYLDKMLAFAAQTLPMGYHAHKEDDNYWFYHWEKPRKPYVMVLLIIVFIFFISTVLFESFRQALVILMLIPISFIGVFLTFYWFRINFDMGGFASFIILSGLTVNSGIYLINDYNFFCKQQSSRLHLQRNYLRAFRHKIQAIVLTIVSTALGMIPFIWAGQSETFWYALAAGTIGGLFFSLVGIFFLLPVLLLGKEKNDMHGGDVK